MNNFKKIAGILAVAVLVTASVRFGASATEGTPSVAISMPAAQSLVLTVHGDGSFSKSVQGALTDTPSDGAVLGGLINNGLSRYEQLDVYGRTSGNAGKSVVAAMADATAATTTACLFLNNSLYTRAVTGAGVIDRGTAASTGAVTWNAGTTTASGAAITYTKVVSGITTRVSGLDALTTTSTAQTATFPWAPGEYLAFYSGSTTNSGTCFVDYASR